MYFCLEPVMELIQLLVFFLSQEEEADESACQTSQTNGADEWVTQAKL